MASTAEQLAGSDLDPAAVSEVVLRNEKGQVRFRILAYIPGDTITPEALRDEPVAKPRHLTLIR
jgi:hypothetical protein